MDIGDLLLRAAAMGIAGSALIDVWSLFVRRAFGISGLNYRMLGRWIGHFPEGRFLHARIAAAAPVRGEAVIGWSAHYAIGVSFAAVLLLAAGNGWADSPTPLPALAVGIGTILAPWLVMQPAFGLGVAGAKTPAPWANRLRNLATHTVYGLGLYVSALALSLV
jgi:hypothetical protein